MSKPSIVFAHGLWADGSCFSKLIPTLRAEGHECIAAEYGLATRDLSLFDQQVKWSDGGTGTLWEHLKKAFAHQESQRGPHGGYLIGGTGDWSDFSTQFLQMTESSLVTAPPSGIAPGNLAENHWFQALRHNEPACDVVRHEQRLRPDHDDVVDHHADQVLADGVVLVEGLGDGNLGTDPVGRRREQRATVRLQERNVEESGESANATENLGSVRLLDGRLHQFDGQVARSRVDAGLAIAGAHETSLPHGDHPASTRRDP